MISTGRACVLTFSVMAVCGIAIAAGQQAAVTGPFTAEQAANGRAAYQSNCASCHRPDLRGSGEASPLAGTNFMSTWGDRSARDLFEKIQSSMPPGAEGTLGEAACLSIVAYVLQLNGYPAGTKELPPDPKVLSSFQLQFDTAQVR